MRKIVLLGDTHFGASASSDIVHDYFEKFYDYFFDYLDKHNIQSIIQLGDLYDRRREVHFNTLHRSNSYFFDKLHGKKLYVIAGNHDCAKTNTNKINSVSLLKTGEMYVIDMKPETILIEGVLFDMYPWINSENLSESIEFQKESHSQYAVGHFEFNGFPMHPGTLCESGISHSQFSRYDKVFSGHFHTISQTGNVLYTGTPCELSWSDWSDPKGFWILDLDTGALEHVRNPYTLFEKIIYTEGMVYDFSRSMDKYVKVVVANKTDQKKFDAFIDNINRSKPHSLKIVETSISEAAGESTDTVDMASTQTMLSDVVDNLDTPLDKVVLKTHIMSIYAEAMQLSKTV